MQACVLGARWCRQQAVFRVLGPTRCLPPTHPPGPTTPRQDAIDPTYGNEASAELRKEISRLQHRYGDLLREQERLVGEMERAVLKRAVISVKV